jgi:hypothetical protein
MRTARSGRGPHRWSGLALAVIGLTLVTAGCAPVPDRVASRARELVELDENTDPRFLRGDAGPLIGRVVPAGRNVYVDGRPITRPTPLGNGGHVRTGPDSGALVEVSVTRAAACILEIRDFHRGGLYGEAPACTHRAWTPAGEVNTTVGGTHYQVWLEGARADVLVLKGELTLRPDRSPAASRTLGRNQQAVMTPHRVSTPVELTPSAARELLRWRRDFELRVVPERGRTREPGPERAPPPAEVAPPPSEAPTGFLRDLFRLGTGILGGRTPRSESSGDREVGRPEPTPGPQTGPTPESTPEPSIEQDSSAPSVRGLPRVPGELTRPLRVPTQTSPPPE